LSESSLKKDWLSDEEDEAWQNLGQGVDTVSENKPVPKFGSAKGLVKMSDDFDEP
jgi:hypothetical protein